MLLVHPASAAASCMVHDGPGRLRVGSQNEPKRASHSDPGFSPGLGRETKRPAATGHGFEPIQEGSRCTLDLDGTMHIISRDETRLSRSRIPCSADLRRVPILASGRT
ncbi:hypothetical protein E4U53_000738 [Claviceps sorghi]|nr:hypothetical protein E4U53_000738 [Claviceps sorghi]